MQGSVRALLVAFEMERWKDGVSERSSMGRQGPDIYIREERIVIG